MIKFKDSFAFDLSHLFRGFLQFNREARIRINLKRMLALRHV